MTAVPTPVLLLTAALALVAVIALWKLLMVAGLIGLAQWAVITQAEDPTAVLVVVGVPALALVALARRARRPALSRPPVYLRRQEVSR